MNIQYLPAAVADLQNTCLYIAEKLKNPTAAYRLKERILQSISLLKDNPLMGRPFSTRFDDWNGTDYRYFIVAKQLIFYRVSEHAIHIIRILDSRTDYLTELFS